MFIGAIPKEIVEQAVRVVRIDTWREVFVCCSGSFRIERALRERFPALKIHSNDVSLLTCVVGKLAAGSSVDVTFTNALAFMEEALDGAEPRARAAAVLVALEMARYTGPSAFAKRRFTHYVQNFQAYLDKAFVRLGAYLEELRIDSFFPGDFREHARRGIERGAAIVAWPPTYKGGYERLYKFLSANTSWAEPRYDVFDPADLAPWIGQLRESGAQFWVGADRQLDGLEPAFAYFGSKKRPVYSYATTRDSSIRTGSSKATPFRYEPLDASKLTKSTAVRVVPFEASKMAFLKDRYLAPGLVHHPGSCNFLVLLDGMVAGGIVYRKDAYGDRHTAIVLSDFSTSRERKVSKLIAMLAASREPVSAFDRHVLQKSKSVLTMVFTDKPVSMKYRGIYELKTRKPGCLQYAAPVSAASPGEVYRDWWQRFGREAGAPDRAA